MPIVVRRADFMIMDPLSSLCFTSVLSAVHAEPQERLWFALSETESFGVAA